MTIARMLVAAVCALAAGILVERLKPLDPCPGCAVVAASAIGDRR